MNVNGLSYTIGRYLITRKAKHTTTNQQTLIFKKKVLINFLHFSNQMSNRFLSRPFQKVTINSGTLIDSLNVSLHILNCSLQCVPLERVYVDTVQINTRIQLLFCIIFKLNATTICNIHFVSSIFRIIFKKIDKDTKYLTFWGSKALENKRKRHSNNWKTLALLSNVQSKLCGKVFPMQIRGRHVQCTFMMDKLCEQWEFFFFFNFFFWMFFLCSFFQVLQFISYFHCMSLIAAGFLSVFLIRMCVMNLFLHQIRRKPLAWALCEALTVELQFFMYSMRVFVTLLMLNGTVL